MTASKPILVIGHFDNRFAGDYRRGREFGARWDENHATVDWTTGRVRARVSDSGSLLFFARFVLFRCQISFFPDAGTSDASQTRLNVFV